MLPDLIDSIRTSFWMRLGLILWLVLFSVVAVRATLMPRKNSVYPAYHAAGEHFLHNEDLYHRQDPSQGIDLFRYVPSFAAFMIPMTILPEAWAGGVWRVLQGLALLWVLILLGNRFWTKPNQKGLFLALCVPLSIGSLNNGQVNPLITISLGLGLVWSLESRWWIAGFALSVAVFLKVFPLAVALLFVLVGGWRLALGLLIGLLFTEGFSFWAGPWAYVLRQWAEWVDLLGHDDRRSWPIEAGYRDFWMLLKIIGATPPMWVYQGIQAGSGLVLAIIVFWVSRKWGALKGLLLAWGMGSCWIMVFGPTTESSTYTLLAPVLGFALMESFSVGTKRFFVFPIWLAGILLLGGVFAGAFPNAGKLHAFGMQPIGAILLGVGLFGLLLSPDFKLRGSSSTLVEAENRVKTA